MSEDVRPVDPAELDEEIPEAWRRWPDGEGYLRGVEVASGEGLEDEPFDWLVTVSARQYFKDDPLGLELQRRLESAMLAVPGVTLAVNASWETWYVVGKASGEALCRACATVVDDLAGRMREAFGSSS
jgi:hypothetical protein